MLRNAVLFLILAPYDNEQSDLIHRVSEEKTLDEIPLYRYIILIDFLTYFNFYTGLSSLVIYCVSIHVALIICLQ